MFDASDQPPREPDPGPEPDPEVEDPMIALAERHLHRLRIVGDWAMDAAQACAGLVTASGERSRAVICEVEGVWSSESAKQTALRGHRDAADAFHTITRALRLTFALETATAERLRGLREGAPRRAVRRGREPAAPTQCDPAPTGTAAPDPSAPAADFPDDDFAAAAAPDPAADPSADPSLDVFRETVRDLVGEAIAAEVGPGPIGEGMLADARERLAERDRFAPLMLRPLREVVEEICRDIGLQPDWSCWTGEAWKPDYVPRPGPDWPLPLKPRPPGPRAALAAAIATPAPPEPPLLTNEDALALLARSTPPSPSPSAAGPPAHPPDPQSPGPPPRKRRHRR